MRCLRKRRDLTSAYLIAKHSPVNFFSVGVYNNSDDLNCVEALSCSPEEAYLWRVFQFCWSVFEIEKYVFRSNC